MNEVCSRAYDIGRWPDASTEIEIATADKRQDSSGDYENQWFCYVDAENYDGAIAFRIDKNGYRIKPLSALYNESEMGWGSFIDMGLVTTSGSYERRYRMPLGATGTDNVTAWVKKRYVNLYNDTDLLPVRSFAALKAGVLAVSYENENEEAKSQRKWQEFEALLLRDDKQFAGNKTQRAKFKIALNHTPTSFR